jgi:hypothetical protein
VALALAVQAPASSRGIGLRQAGTAQRLMTMLD